MSDAEEAELRKEQLRLQNAVLAQQLLDRARAEQRVESTKRVAAEVGAVGLKAGKILALVVAAVVAVVVVLLVVVAMRENAAEESERKEATERAQAECRSAGGTPRVFVTLPGGRHGSVNEDEFEKMPVGTTRGKKCFEVMRGEYPY